MFVPSCVCFNYRRELVDVTHADICHRLRITNARNCNENLAWSQQCGPLMTTSGFVWVSTAAADSHIHRAYYTEQTNRAIWTISDKIAWMRNENNRTQTHGRIRTRFTRMSCVCFEWRQGAKANKYKKIVGLLRHDANAQIFIVSRQHNIAGKIVIVANGSESAFCMWFRWLISGFPVGSHFPFARDAVWFFKVRFWQ